MTTDTNPDSGRIITSGDVINDLHDTIDQREAVIKLLEQDSADAHARITELEAQLAQRFDAADMATAAAQGFRDGAAKEQQEGWQPIETAPKDSSYVLLAGKHRKDIASGYWLQSAYAGNGAWIWPFVHKYPTHWIPLPAPGPADGESNETQ